MILKALYDYYQRSGNLAPFGTEFKDIPFLIVINREGRFLRLEDRRIDKKNVQKFLVVKGTRTSGIKPYRLWDNVEYVANYTKEHAELNEITDALERENLLKSISKSQAKHNAFIKQCIDLAEHFSDNTAIGAVAAFFKTGELGKIYSDPLWPEIAKKPIVNLSFLLEGNTSIVAEEKCLRPSKKNFDSNNSSICLVTGNYGIPVESTTPTPIQGGQAIGRLVAFQVNSGYDSYGKSKGRNAPISEEAADKYTSALNRLLARDSNNKFVIGNRTFVFWASSTSPAAKEAEQAMFELVKFSNDSEDDPNARIDRVRSVFINIFSGKTTSRTDDRFFFLGLAPNSARIAVIYWNECPLKEFAARILQHFNDMEISDTRKERKPYAGIFQILSAVTLKGRSSDAQPNLPEAILKAILQGSPYPYALLLACIKRIRAEQAINITRAAIIKAFINRTYHLNSKLQIMLDNTNTNPGYVCGRLFAVLEYVQERANGSSTIRSRYMNSASATPAVVFSTLLNLSVHHIEKLIKGQQIFFEKLKSEILSLLGANGFPSNLNLQDQGRFMVGYYHQRQELFSKKTDNQDLNKNE